MGLSGRTQGVHPELGPTLPVRGQVEGSHQKGVYRGNLWESNYAESVL